MSFIASRIQAVKISDLAAALQDISAACQASKTKWVRKQARPDVTTLGQSATRNQGLLGVSEATLSLGGLMKFPTFSGTPVSYSGGATNAPIHGRNTQIIIDQYALKAFIQSGSLKRSIVLPDTNGLGDPWKKHGVLGLQTAKFNFAGLYDSVASGIDARLRALAAASSVSPFVVGYNGFAIGSFVDMGQIANNGFNVGGDQGGAVPISGDFDSDGIVETGVSLHDLATPETATVNSNAVDFGAATAFGAAAQLHVTAFTGTNATIKVQHSTDNISFPDLIAFTLVTGATSERKGTNADPEAADTTTVNRYTRSAITAATALTSITYTVAFARRTYTNTTYAPAGTHAYFAGLLTITTSPTFNYSPESLTAGKRNFTGACRMQDYSVSFKTTDVIDWSATFMSDDTVTEGTN